MNSSSVVRLTQVIAVLVAAAGLVGSSILVSFLASVFARHFDELLTGKPLPWPTDLVLAFGNWTPLFGLIAAGVISAPAVVIIRRAQSSEGGSSGVVALVTLSWVTSLVLLALATYSLILPLLSITYRLGNPPDQAREGGSTNAHRPETGPVAVSVEYAKGDKFVGFSIRNNSSSALEISATVESRIGSGWQEVYSDAFLSAVRKEVLVYRIESAKQKRGKFDVESIMNRLKTSKLTLRAVVYDVSSDNPKRPERIAVSEEIVVEGKR